MQKLIRLANEIKSKYDVSLVPEFENIIDELLSIEAIDNNGTKVRYRDYIVFDRSYSENYDYFKEYYNDEDKLLGFNIYYLNNQLLDILELIECGDMKIEDLNDLYDESFFKDIVNIISNTRELLGALKNDDDDYSKITNLIIFPNNLDDIIKLSSNSRNGLGDNSIKKSMQAINTLMNSSYNDPHFSRFIHKVKAGKMGEDFRLTDSKILGERYTTGKPVKVMFFKLPISSENLDMIKDKLGNKNLEYIYYVSGFGSFEDIGISEPVLYKELIDLAIDGENYLQGIVNFTSTKFDEHGLEEMINIIKDSMDSFKDMSMTGEENERKKAI